jgi:ABC-2 type transport system ATP-binding protein
MENVSSFEGYQFEDGNVRQVLRDISLVIYAGETWGVTGNHTFELKLLLEIMANVKPYLSGRCVLNERGMLRKKRVILPHVFYIGDSHMLFDNLNVLEYIMFATDKKGINPVDRQEEILELLVASNLGFLCLVPIKYLTKAQKAVVTLVTAVFCSTTKLIVFNVPELEFDETLYSAMAKISQHIRSMDKTLVLCTKDPMLIQAACDNIAVILDGSLKFSGTTDAFYDRFDRIVFRIKMEQPEDALKLLQSEMPAYSFEIIDGRINVFDYNKIGLTHEQLYDTLIRLRLEPELVEKSKNSVENAYREVVKQYDLQKQLP